MPSPRPRRLFLALLSLPALFLLFLYLSAPAPRRTFLDLFSDSSKLPDEIFGLLHFVTSPDEAGRVLSTSDVAPDKPVSATWYALGSIANAGHAGPRPASSARAGWDRRLRVLRDEHPLVVFSKSNCPYSKRAKRLLETYDLLPAPKIVEVDLRADSLHIKTILTRLTHRSTVPNVVLHGRSLGGSDELVQLHQEGRLRGLLEKAGMKIRRTEEGGEGIQF